MGARENGARPGLAYLERKERQRRLNPKERSPRAELRSFDRLIRHLNQCCTKFGKKYDKTKNGYKNGCKNCPDSAECIGLFDQRCAIKS